MTLNNPLQDVEGVVVGKAVAGIAEVVGITVVNEVAVLADR